MFTATGSATVTGTVTATTASTISFVGAVSTINGVGILTYTSGTVPQIGMIITGTGINVSPSTYIVSGTSPTFILNQVPTAAGTGVAIQGVISLVSVGSASGLVALEPFTVTGTGGGGLSAATYYIINPTAGSNQISLATSLANAQTGVAITNLTTATLVATTFTAGGPDSNITFSYNPVTGTMAINSAASGLLSVLQDVSPSLGGDLLLNSKNITGTGSINITGGITASGSITSSTGNIVATSGNVTASGYVAASSFQATSITNGISLKSSNLYPLDNYVITDGTPNGSPAVRFLSAKGTLAAPTNLAAGNSVSTLGWYGYYNGTYTEAAGLNVNFDATANMSLANPASNLIIGVNNSSNGFVPFRFNYTGIFITPSLTYGLEIPTVNYIAVGATNTYVLSTTATHNVLVVSSTGYTATLTFPSTGLFDGQLIKIAVSTNTVTLALTAGPTLVGTFAGSVTAPTTITYIYRASNTSWYRLS
jgi:hypothetical protein